MPNLNVPAPVQSSKLRCHALPTRSWTVLLVHSVKFRCNNNFSAIAATRKKGSILKGPQKYSDRLS